MVSTTQSFWGGLLPTMSFDRTVPFDIRMVVFFEKVFESLYYSKLLTNNRTSFDFLWFYTTILINENHQAACQKMRIQ